jgi:hypothetical protein
MSCCFGRFFLLDARLPATCARPFSEKENQPQLLFYLFFFFSLPFFGVVCHTSDPSQGFYFEAMAAHDKLA